VAATYMACISSLALHGYYFSSYVEPYFGFKVLKNSALKTKSSFSQWRPFHMEEQWCPYKSA
jgi:hypothetical protein